MECDFGMTSNGSPQRQCQKCDISCSGCRDDHKVGDVFECLECTTLYPFRLENTNFCLASCFIGLFEIEPSVCGNCTAPCQSCVDTRDKCTSCVASSSLSNLYQETCIDSCPAKTTSVVNVCEPCQSPCETCSGLVTNCLTCDKTDGRVVLFQNQCYDKCPEGFATNYDTLQCTGCLPGCALCNLDDTNICLECSPPLGLFEGQCRGSCPDPLKERDGKCVFISSADDLVLMYFPFLIAATIFIMVVLAGKLKKKAMLVDGRMRMISS